MKVILIDSDLEYSNALMREATEQIESIEFNHYPSLKYVEAKHASFPVNGADLIIVNSRTLDKNPNWATKESIQEIFGAVPVIVNLDPKDTNDRKSILQQTNELNVVRKGKKKI